jgi:hypothetical protein
MDTTSSGAIPDFLSRLWDRALGVFDRVADLELGKRELSVQRDIHLFSTAQAAETAQRQTTGFGSGELVAGVSNTTLLIVGGLGIVGLVLLTR